MKSLFLTMVLAAGTMAAGPLLVSTGGTFSGSTPSSFFTAPNQTWALSFVVDNNPSVSNVSAGHFFDAAFSGVSYLLNGSSVGVNVIDIRLFSTVEGGGFNVCLSGACTGDHIPTFGFSFVSGQLYSGSESSPTILAGVYPFVGHVVLASVAFDLPSGNITIAAPEPASWITLGAGIALIAWRRRRV